MARGYRRDVKGKMKRFGLLGAHIGYSFSPAWHSAFYQKNGLDATYELIDIPQEAMNEQRFKKLLEDYDGLNVTIPYKTWVLEFLDAVDERAAAIGAVNTIKIDGGQSIGYNTDCLGFEATVRQLGSKLPQTAYIFGTGGAGKMAQYVLKSMGVKAVNLVSRTNGCGAYTYDALKSSQLVGALLVNTTPVGSQNAPDRLPIKSELLDGVAAVFDLIYTPEETPLIEAAKSRGIPALNGLHMLHVQALEAEIIWWQRSFNQ